MTSVDCLQEHLDRLMAFHRESTSRVFPWYIKIHGKADCDLSLLI
jgi:hypothetical protein